MRRRRTRARALAGLLAVAVTVLVVAVGCAGHGSPGAAPTASSTPTPTAVTPSTPPPPDPPPQVGSCHRLGFAAAGEPTDSRAPVPCGGAHTSVTIAVGHVDQVVDGHLLAIDSHAVQEQLANRCPRKLPGYVGGDREARRLSRFHVVWFGPSVDQADLGADWFRCDVVAVAAENHLAHLGPHLRGVLGRAGALDRYGTCGTAAPGSAGFHRVICARQHSWRAVQTIPLSQGAHYLGKAAGAAANARCKSIAADRAGGALKYTWSFEWPTREEWRGGQRYGFCWLPS